MEKVVRTRHLSIHDWELTGREEYEVEEVWMVLGKWWLEAVIRVVAVAFGGRRGWNWATIYSGVICKIWWRIRFAIYVWRR